MSDNDDPQERYVQVMLPRITRAMKLLSVVSGVVWLLEVLVSNTGIGGATSALGAFEWLALVPARVLHGEVWRVVTHPFLHDPQGAVAILFNVVTFWLLGSPLEHEWGTRRVVHLLGVSTLAGVALVMAAAFALAALGDRRVMDGVTISPSAASTALVVAWGVAHAEDSLSFFGLAQLRGKHLVWITAAFVVLGLVMQRSGGNVASLAGLGVGAVFHRWRAKPTRKRKTAHPVVSAPRLRVIKGDGDGSSNLPN